MAKKGSVRRYFGRKRRSAGKMTVPIMGIATAAALGAGVLTNNKNYRASRPIDYISKGDFANAGGVALDNMTKAGTYTPMVVPVVVWIAGRLLLGKRKITKRISLF